MKILYVVIIGFAIPASMWVIEVITPASPSISPLENIHGIPYPHIGNGILVTEHLAHADIYLTEPAFGKSITLKFEYDPKELQTLSVGIREGGFWLSYPKHTFWEHGKATGWQGESITIPITDAFVDTDRSLDVMFFSQGVDETPAIDSNTSDTTAWEIRNIEVTTALSSPSNKEVRNFLRSIVKKERAL